MKTENIMDVEVFRKMGYLQELNRLFLHPLGLALSIIVEEDGKEHFGEIWDYREAEEGIYYDLKNSKDKRIKEFKKKQKFIEKELLERIPKRIKKLGFGVESIE